MNKLEEIHSFLKNLQTMVSEKREQQELELQQSTPNLELETELQLSLEHTKGQLYEINYILENFWNIISKD